MANVSPATVTVTGSTGPGVAVTAQKFTDVIDINVDVLHNTLKITRLGGVAITYYDYSALSTVVWTIVAGVTTVVFS